MSRNNSIVLLIILTTFLSFSVVGCVSAADVPSANFTSNVTNDTGSVSVQFNDTSTGNPTSWSWNFGDNQTSTQQNSTHNYSTPGNYTVTLTVANGAGNNTITKTNYILVYGLAAANRFTNPSFEDDTTGWTTGSTTTLNNTQSHDGENSVQFSSSGSQNTNYLEQNIDLTLVDSISFWGYGEDTSTSRFYLYIDGNYVKSFKSVSNTWTQYTLDTSSYPGLHNITIKWLKGANAYVDDFTVTITENSANFTTTTINNSTEPLTVQFIDTSIGLITSWAWDFDGDGVIDSTLQNPIYTYTEPDTYTVILTVTGPYYSSTMTYDNLFTVVGPTNTRTGKTYTTIQEAIDDVETRDGDTILVGSTSYLETYTENINITKKLTIVAQGNVIVTALDTNTSVFTVTSSGTGSVISGFTITGATNSNGIYISPLTTVTITNNTITDNNIGINVNNGTSTINFNNIYGNSAYGLRFTGTGVDATNNWWSTNNPTYANGTTAPGEVAIYEAQNTNQTVYDPWIVLTVTVSDDLLKEDDNSTVTVDMTHNSHGQDTSSSGTIPDLPVNFNYTLGTLTTTNTTVSRGKSSTRITAGSISGTDNVTVTVSEYTVTIPVTVDTITPTVDVSLEGGRYNTKQTVTLTTDDDTATIYYTLDTSDPRTSNTRIKYTGSVVIDETTALRYVVVDPAGNWSPVYTQNYVIGTTGLANSDWPSFQNDEYNTGQSDYVGPQNGTVKWTYGNLTVYGSAVIGSDGTIYVGGYDGVLYVFSSEGVLQWTWTTRSYLLGSPTIGIDGTIYISNWMNSTIYAISSNGTLQWKYVLGDYNFGSSPVIGSDGTIYITVTNSMTGTLYALYPTGMMKWTYTTGSLYASSPVIGSDGTIYIVDYDGVLYAIKPDGTLKWDYNLKYSIYSSKMCYNTPSIGSDGTIYIASYISYYGNNYYYDSDGKFHKLTSDSTYTGTNGCSVFAITDNENSASLKWVCNTGETLYGTPAISTDGTIYVVGDSQLYAISSSGDILWTYDTGGVSTTSSTSAVIGSDGTIYVGSSTGLYALNSDGTLKWSYATGDICGSPAISNDGTLYIGTAKGIFYAFNDIAADFMVKTVNGTVLTVKFMDNSTCSPISWSWDFGDGTNSTEETPAHTYSEAGAYTIVLSVTLEDGIVITRTKTVTIEEMDITAPTVDVNINGGVFENSQTITLNATDDSDNVTIYYTTDGSNPTNSNTRNIYTGPIVLYDTTTVNYAAVDLAGNWSPTYNETYTILNVVYVEDASYYNNATINQDIQSILDNTSPGSTIVFLGQVYENLHLTISKQLNIVSNVGTKIISNLSEGAVFLISGSQASGTQIYGFNITNTGMGSGILVNNTSNVTISNVQVSSTNGIAILVEGSSNVTVNCSSLTNSITGIKVNDSDNTHVTSSDIMDNSGRGIGIYNSTNITVDNSTIERNGTNASTNDEGGVYVQSSDGVTIENNQINENFEGVSTRDVSNFILHNNTISDNIGDGVYLMGYANNLTITYNTITNDCNGIKLDYTSGKNIIIQSNTITGMIEAGYDGKHIPDYTSAFTSSGDGITFGVNYGTGLKDIDAISSELTLKHNVIYNNSYRNLDMHDSNTDITYVDSNVYGLVWSGNNPSETLGVYPFCCKFRTTASLLKLVRTGSNTYTAYFVDGDTGEIIEDLPVTEVTFSTLGISKTVQMVNGIATVTFDVSSILEMSVISAGMTTYASWDSLIENGLVTGNDGANGEDQGYAAGSGTGSGNDNGPGSEGSDTSTGNNPGSVSGSGTGGSSGGSSSGTSSGLAATLGSASALSAAGDAGSSSQGGSTGQSDQTESKTVQELTVDDPTDNTQIWGIIGIIALLILVLGAYYRNDLKNMIRKSKK